jgi:hypothetical protein
VDTVTLITFRDALNTSTYQRYARRTKKSEGGSREYKQLRGCTNVYPKISGLAAWSENCKWYSSLPLGAVVSLFFESV